MILLRTDSTYSWRVAQVSVPSSESCEDAVLTHKTSERCQKKCRLGCKLVSKFRNRIWSFSIQSLIAESGSSFSDVIYDVKLAGLAKIPQSSPDM